MSKNRGNLFERYIDKAVLGITSIACLCLLWFFVIASPYSVEYNESKVSPARINTLIKDGQAKRLQDKLAKLPELKTYSGQKAESFAKRVDCTLSLISDDVQFPLPPRGGKAISGPRRYRKPDIGDITDVSAEAIRTVAYVPIDEITVEKTYRQAETELGDIDLITVEGKFDVAALYEDFYRCFVSRVKREWKEEQFTIPIFAAVSLERRQILEDGTNTQWQRVPRMKIDHLRAILDIPDKVQDRNTIDLLRLKFDNYEVQKEIIQPDPYDLAASNVQWLTPELHKEFIILNEKEQEKLKREELERIKEQRENAAGTSRNRGRTRGSRTTTSRTSRRTPSSGRTRRGGDTEDDFGGYGRDRERLLAERKREALRKEEERTIDVLYDELDGLYIEEDTDLAGLRERLVVWAHDDTAEPDRTYQYRMRIGTFNPIAGRQWLREEDQEHNDDLVFWSEYSEVTEPITIDKRTYFFPQGVTAGKVNVQVSKYHNGLWRNEEFKVATSEVIGKPVEIEAQKDVYQLVVSTYESDSDVELVDFTTGATLIDIANMTMWDGIKVLKPKEYSEILYTRDGEDILHMPIKSRNWPSDMLKKYNEIAEAAQENVTIVARGIGRQRKGRPRRPRYDMDFGGLDEEMLEDLMYEMGR